MNNFFIQRVQVEGGFLDGFDLNLENGLNTIIGARGTGKSTFIELIRYGLNIKGHSLESSTKALNHALSVLKDGQVTITLSNGQETFSLSRTSEDKQETKLPYNIKIPLIFSQTEVETVGLLEKGRLKIIDSFIEEINSYKEKELSIIVKINSISKELQNITEDITNYEDQLLPLENLRKELKLLEIEENKISEISQQAASKSIKLKKLSEAYSKQALTLNYIKEFTEKENAWQNEIINLINNIPDITPWRGEEKNPISDILKERELLKTSLISKINEYSGTFKITEEHILKIHTNIQEITKEGQQLRTEVDNLQNGAGEISRKCQKLRSDIKHLEITKLNLEDKIKKIKQLQNERNLILNTLEDIREKRSRARVNVCEGISFELSPKIRVGIEVSSLIDDYNQVLTNALKGTGIKYNDIVSVISETIPPRELINIIENDNIDDFISFISISKDRASKIISNLKLSIYEIATVLLEDRITFNLNDGTEWKDFSELSTGQRCTVILPIILQHKDTILVIDQPEDHIDNAFIVETLISSILKRKDKGQIIVTTHNANVPVLGNANIVAHLSSDGKRGFIQSFGSLSNKKIVDAISKVMEGGEKAFKYRADFYGI